MDSSWPFGIELAPDGDLAREFVQRIPVWSSGLFITEYGSCYRRYLHKDHSYSWQLVELADDPASGRVGYHIHGVFVSVETAIATAWYARAPESRARAVVLDPSRELHVDNVAWREPGNCSTCAFMSSFCTAAAYALSAVVFVSASGSSFAFVRPRVVAPPILILSNKRSVPSSLAGTPQRHHI